MPRVLGLDVDGVLFDCDGVLTDSEPLSMRAWALTLDELGAALAPDRHTGFVGVTDREVARWLGAELGLDPDLLEATARRLLLELLDEGVPRFDDAVAMLERLVGEGVPVAVASNSFRWRLDAVLAAAGLGELVEVTVAADEVAEPKPAPDVYLEGARRLGLEPGRCLVIEDSPTGIAAGRAAGMGVVAVDRGMFEAGRLAEADRVVAVLEPAMLEGV